MTSETRFERHSDAPAEIASPPVASEPEVPQGPAQTAARGLRGLLSGALLGAAALAGVMAFQSARHGWPFSLHHGYVNVGGKVVPAPAAPGSSNGSPMAQPRAAIMLSSERASEFGIQVEAVRSEPMARTIRAVAVVVPDESRVSEIHTRVSGWIEQLYINKTGQPVRAGQALAAIFSPDLLAAQSELLAVKKAPAIGGQTPLLDGARSRLRVLGMSSAQIAALEASGEAARLVTVSSPRQGVVIRRTAAVGTAVDPSTELMTVADLSKVWVFAEVPERDVPDVPTGIAGALEFPAAGNARLDAKVAFVYPTLTERTRTLRVRFELDNPGQQLKPGMYGSAVFETGERRALTVARDAIVDTGLEQHVFIVEGPEHYVPRKVEVGVQLGDRVEIRSGLSEQEKVVASGVFLIDSESRLRASGGGAMAGMKMDSDEDQAAMSGMKMDSAPGSAVPAPRPRPSAAAKPHAPSSAPSSHAGHAMAPMQMPMDMPMDMPMPAASGGASNPHAGHGE